MNPMVFVWVPILLSAVLWVVIFRKTAEALDEVAHLRVVLARVQTLRPVARDVTLGARRLQSGLDQLGGR